MLATCEVADQFYGPSKIDLLKWFSNCSWAVGMPTKSMARESEQFGTMTTF